MLLAGAALGAAAWPTPSAVRAEGDDARRPESERAFSRVAEVLKHPRCMNCHPSGDFPRQADDRHRHLMLVARGADDRGTSAMRCATCHQTMNTSDGRVPGAPHWQLAPRSMGWEGLSDGDLCRALTDPKRNRGRSIAALEKHMTTDALVQWAWNPGARTAPPVTQADFHEAVRRWVATGAACPR